MILGTREMMLKDFRISKDRERIQKKKKCEKNQTSFIR